MQLKMKMPKKTVYDKLVTKINNIDTSGFVLKIKYDTDKSDLEKKISNAEKTFQMLVDLLKTYYNATITEVEGKVPSISGLATLAALTAAEKQNT